MNATTHPTSADDRGDIIGFRDGSPIRRHTTSADDRLVAATVPYALTGLGNHMIDHQLPAPRSIEVPGYAGRPITVWLAEGDVDVWATTGITLDYDSHTTHDAVSVTSQPFRHQVEGVLDGSCLTVRLLWIDNTATFAVTPGADHA